MTRRIEVTVSSASLDEPEVLTVEETPAVRYAIEALRLHCATCGDGFVEVHGSEAADCTEDEFLETVANMIGGTVDEIDELLAAFNARNPSWKNRPRC